MDYRDQQERYDYFMERTNKHINLVKEYYNLICQLADIDPLDIIDAHDASKYLDPELAPYIYLTWKYKCGDEKVPFEKDEEMERAVVEATYHHLRSNPHHPEYWDDGFTRENFNEENRDGVPTIPVDGTKMPPAYIVEMIADWFAVSFEKGNHPLNWAEKMVNKRWLFTEDQTDFIFALTELWDRDIPI